MLQIVPLPVALIDSAPGPKYSMILLVPPLTVRNPHRYVITSLGDVHPESLPVRCTPIELRVEHLPRQPGHDLAAVDAADADGQHAEPAPVRGVGVGADHEAARERVVLQHHLVDDPDPGFQKPMPYFFEAEWRNS